MKLEIQNKKENELLKRTEVTGKVSFTGATPSNKELKGELGKSLGVQKDFIAVRHIYTRFGETLATFEADAYKTKEQFEKLEGKIPEEKKEEKAEAKTEEKPAAAPKEEAKAEKKEEAKPKAEEKKEEPKKEAPKAEEKPAEKKEAKTE